MADKKITELTEVASLPDAALLTGVDTTRAAGDRNVSIQKSNLIPASASQGLNDTIVVNAVATAVPEFQGGLNVGFDNGAPAIITLKGGVGGGSGQTVIASTTGGLAVSHAVGVALTTPYLSLNGKFVNSLDSTGYNATTNTPTLADADSFANGFSTIVTTAGAQDFGSGSITLGVDDVLMKINDIYVKYVNNNQSGGAGGSSTQYMVRNLSDLTTNLTVGTTVDYFRQPVGANLTSITCSLLDAGTVTGVTVDMLVNGVSILSTLLTTDATEKTSTTATTPVVIGTSLIPYDAEITFDIDGVPTAGKGLIVNLELEPV